MSKIDLSRAKIGDKFRTRRGYVVALKDIVQYLGDDVYRLTSPKAFVCVFQNGKMHKDNKESEYDLVEQVFDDEKDRAITDKILNNVEKVTNGVAEAMSLIKSAVIANLPREPLPENNEDDPELQRRQEVVKLADRIFTEKYLQEWYQYLIDNKTTKTDYVTYIFEWAEKFVNAKDKYLKEGKLC